jgi:hypothetical protein
MSAAVYDADQVAELLGCSPWTIYQEVRRAERGEPTGPVGRLALRIGKRLVWPKAPVNALLGLKEAGTP